MNIKSTLFPIILFLVFSTHCVFSQKKPTPKPQSQKKGTSTAQQKPGSKSKAKPASTAILKFTPEQIESFRQQSMQLVKFFEGTLNFLADKGNPVKEKQVIINESYSKVFWDSEVQVEDDLDEKRLVTLYKDVQAYLSDVDFFFKRAVFTYTVQDVSVLTNEIGQTYFRVTANRALTGMTVNNDSVNNNKVRYFEINYDESMEQLKIVSIYTTKYEEKGDLKNWWNQLTQEWKEVFGKTLQLDDTMTMSMLTSIGDSTAQVNGMEVRIDAARVFNLLLQIVNQKEIDLSGNSAITDLTPLSKLSALREVNMANTGIIDLMPLRNLNDIEVLDISGTNVNSLDPLRYNNKIISLKMKKSMISGLEMVSGFSSLEVLDFSNTSVADLLPLKDLTSLKDLRLSGTKVTDLSPLSAMVNLEILYISDLQVSDISAVSGFTGLRLIFLDRTKVASLAALENLSSLQKIYCDNSNIQRTDALQFMKSHPSVVVIFESEEIMKWWSGMTPEWKKIFTWYLGTGDDPSTEQLHRLTTIDSINVSGRLSISTLEPVSVFVQLHYLDCSSTGVTSLDPLKDLKEMKVLSFSNTKVTSLEPLSGLRKLEVITLDNTPVSSIDPLEEIESLRFIFADNSQIPPAAANDFMDHHEECLVVSQTYDHSNWWKNLPRNWKDALLKQAEMKGELDKTQLQQISGLQELVIREDITIVSLQPVLHLKRLKTIEFTDTRVSSLDPLGQMKKLTAIRCMKNPISDLTPIAGMKWLKELDFSNTQVEDLFPLEQLVSLEILKFSGTPVKNLKYLKDIPRLKVMEFYNTRISSLDILEPMPFLESLKIFNTKISEKKVMKFKQTHPKCEVVFY